LLKLPRQKKKGNGELTKIKEIGWVRDSWVKRKKKRQVIREGHEKREWVGTDG